RHAAARRETEGRRGAHGCQRDAPLRAAKRDDDERDLEAFEQYALEREGEAVPVDAAALEPLRCARLLQLLGEDRVLVMQGLEAARAQDGLAQPLKPEREQQPADDEPERVQRDDGQRRAERSDDDRERENGGGN